MIISSQQLGSQEELLNALQQEGYKLTQATLSRDLKQLKVAKAASMSGNYVYVLPNETMYKRVSTPQQVREMMQVPGFVSINLASCFFLRNKIFLENYQKIIFSGLNFLVIVKNFLESSSTARCI